MSQDDIYSLIGTVATEPSEAGARDAIHVPVVQMQVHAKGGLLPGDPVDENGCLCRYHLAIGIVDPWIYTNGRRIPSGSYVLVFLKPGSVTSLRHVWTHPLVPDEGVGEGAIDPAGSTQSRDESEDPKTSEEKRQAFWDLKEFAQWMRVQVPDLIDALNAYSAGRDYCFPYDLAYDIKYFPSSDDVWLAWEKYTGKKRPADMEGDVVGEFDSVTESAIFNRFHCAC